MDIYLFLIVCLLLAFICYKEYQYSKNNKSLLDRLMSKDYREYKTFEQAEQVKLKKAEDKENKKGNDWL